MVTRAEAVTERIYTSAGIRVLWRDTAEAGPQHCFIVNIAHEMGHVLLPYDSHSQTGLMRAGWDKSQAANAVMGNLKFNPGESGLIRRSVAKMAAGGSSLVSASPTPSVPQPEDRSSSDRPIAAR